MLGFLNSAVGVHPSHQITTVVRDDDVDRGVGGGGQLGHPPAQRVDALTGAVVSVETETAADQEKEKKADAKEKKKKDKEEDEKDEKK